MFLPRFKRLSLFLHAQKMMRKTKIFLDNLGLLTEISAFEVRPRNDLLFLRLFMVLIYRND